MNKIEDEEIYAVPNNDLEEDNKIILSVKQEPSMPILKSFILEGLKPESIVKKEPVEITVTGVKQEKKEPIPYAPETTRETQISDAKPDDELSLVRSEEEEIEETPTPTSTPKKIIQKSEKVVLPTIGNEIITTTTTIVTTTTSTTKKTDKEEKRNKAINLINKISNSKNRIAQAFNKWAKLNDFEEETVTDENGKKVVRIVKKIKFKKNVTNMKITEVKNPVNVTSSIDTNELKKEEEENRRKRVISLVTNGINNYRTRQDKLKEFYNKWVKNTLTEEEITKRIQKLKKTITKVTLSKEPDSEKMNKIEDEEIYAVPNNDLEEDNKISFSVKQEPSIPVLKSFILEGLKPESVVKKEPVEITVPGVKSEKKEPISYAPETTRETQIPDAKPDDELSLIKSEEEEIEETPITKKVLEKSKKKIIVPPQTTDSEIITTTTIVTTTTSTIKKTDKEEKRNKAINLTRAKLKYFYF